MTYDFDKPVDRTGSGDLKHCVLEERYGRPDLLPLWVADMDFETPPFITDALRRRLDHSLFGYTVTPPALWPTVSCWINEHHGWQPREDWFSFIPGIVKGIGMAVNVFTQPGDSVIIMPPVYHPFRIVPEGNGRRIVNCPLTPPPDYRIDFERLEQVCDEHCKLLILSNPHNPAGIVWPREVLERLAHFCCQRGIIVISDEIHCDMALFGHCHVPFASVSDEAAACSITFGAPSKTFNIAGIVASYAIVPDTQLREQFYGWIKANEMDEPTIFAPIATMAAFSEAGEEWRRQMISYVEQNVLFVEDYCASHLPQLSPMRPQASFLVWLDCRRLNLSHDALNDLFVNRARLALNDGEMFGPGGEGFMRMNIGTQRTTLHEALNHLHQALSMP